MILEYTNDNKNQSYFRTLREYKQSRRDLLTERHLYVWTVLYVNVNKGNFSRRYRTVYHLGHIGMHYISDPGSVKGAWRLGGGGGSMTKQNKCKFNQIIKLWDNLGYNK